ncbi:MAG: hypothetical protein ACK4TP_10220 [Hyphomicrobium sp.]
MTPFRLEKTDRKSLPFVLPAPYPAAIAGLGRLVGGAEGGRGDDCGQTAAHVIDDHVIVPWVM